MNKALSQVGKAIDGIKAQKKRDDETSDAIKVLGEEFADELGEQIGLIRDKIKNRPESNITGHLEVLGSGLDVIEELLRRNANP